jgi:hypothetical protein
MMMMTMTTIIPNSHNLYNTITKILQKYTAKKRARDREKDQNKSQKKDHFGGCRKM